MPVKKPPKRQRSQQQPRRNRTKIVAVVEHGDALIVAIVRKTANPVLTTKLNLRLRRIRRQTSPAGHLVIVETPTKLVKRLRPTKLASKNDLKTPESGPSDLQPTIKAPRRATSVIKVADSVRASVNAAPESPVIR